MKILKTVIYLSLIIFASCDEDFFEQVVAVEIPEHTPALAVTANLTEKDTNLVVYISSSVGILDTVEPVIIDNASVELLKNGSLLHVFSYLGEGVYTAPNVNPLGNSPEEYTLTVAAPDFETVSAVQQMPQPVEILDVSFELDGTITPDGDRANEIIVEIDDPENVENFYGVEAYFRITSGDESYLDHVYLDSFNPLVEEGDDLILLPDGGFNGQDYKLNLYTYHTPWEADKVELIIHLISLTKDKYFFEKSLRTYEDTNDNPFAEPIVVHNNIENGHGIFTLASRSEFVLEID